MYPYSHDFRLVCKYTTFVCFVAIDDVDVGLLTIYPGGFMAARRGASAYLAPATQGHPTAGQPGFARRATTLTAHTASWDSQLCAARAQMASCPCTNAM